FAAIESVLAGPRKDDDESGANQGQSRGIRTDPLLPTGLLQRECRAQRLRGFFNEAAGLEHTPEPLQPAADAHPRLFDVVFDLVRRLVAVVSRCGHRTCSAAHSASRFRLLTVRRGAKLPARIL